MPRWENCRGLPVQSRRIPADAIAWVLHFACQNPKVLGYSYELWTYALLQWSRAEARRGGGPTPSSRLN